MSLSTNISDDAAHGDAPAAGAKYNSSLAALELCIGISHSQLGHDGDDNSAIGEIPLAL